MIKAKLEDERIFDTPLIIEFGCFEDEELKCKDKSEDKLWHITKVINSSCGVRYFNFKIVFSVDDEDINICKGLNPRQCKKPPPVIAEIKTLGQQYWQGSKKTINNRICVPDSFKGKDFNVSYEYSVEFSSRDQQDVNANKSIQGKSNMYVEKS